MELFGKFLAAVFEMLVMDDAPEVEDNESLSDSSPEMVRRVSADGEIEWVPIGEGFDSGLD